MSVEMCKYLKLMKVTNLHLRIEIKPILWRGLGSKYVWYKGMTWPVDVRKEQHRNSLFRYISLWEGVVVLKGPSFVEGQTEAVYLELVYLVTALVPSDTACLANSPGRRRRTAVWISLLVIVERLL